MATSQTTNLNLIKYGAGTDNFIRTDYNGNMDKIDAYAGTTNQAITNINNTLIPYSEDPAASDMNSITSKAGVPYTGRWAGGSTSNAPINYNQGVYYGFKSSANYETQFAIDNSGNAYIRGKTGGTWNGWSLVSNNQNRYKSYDISSYFTIATNGASSCSGHIVCSFNNVTLTLELASQPLVVGENTLGTLSKFYPTISAAVKTEGIGFHGSTSSIGDLVRIGIDNTGVIKAYSSKAQTTTLRFSITYATSDSALV